MAYYWVAVNGRQVGLPFDNLEAAKKLLLKHVSEEEAALALIEVYRRRPGDAAVDMGLRSARLDRSPYVLGSAAGA